MLLSDMTMGKKVIVKSINADDGLKRRLRALGLTKNSKITVLEESIGKQNMKISIGSTEIALRITEAQTIDVEEIK